MCLPRRHATGGGGWLQILAAVDLLVPASFSEFKDVYLVSDLMETDMHRVIYSRQKLSEDHIKCVSGLATHVLHSMPSHSLGMRVTRVGQ